MHNNQPPPGYPQQQWPQQPAPQQQQAQGFYQPPQQQIQPQQAPPPMQQPMQPPAGFQPSQAPAFPQQAVPPGQPQVQFGGFEPSAEVIASSQARAEEIRQNIAAARAGFSGGGLNFFNMPGPNGQPFGKAAYVGYRVTRAFYGFPSWVEGKDNFREVIKHFFKTPTKPQGESGYCPEQNGEHCYVCEAFQLALDQGQKNPFGRSNRRFIYQGAPFDYDENTGLLTPRVDECMNEDGSMTPALLDAPSTLHDLIQALRRDRGWGNLFSYQNGRPLKIEREKTGNNSTDVKWGALDLNPMPLPEIFYPALGALHNLDDLFKAMTVEKQRELIIACNLPIPVSLGGTGQPMMQPGMMPHQQVQQPMQMPVQGFQQQPTPIPQGTASFQQGANPPHASPYQQPQAPVPATQAVGMPVQNMAGPGQPPPLAVPQGGSQHTYAPQPGAPPPVRTPVPTQGMQPAAGGPPPPVRTPVPGQGAGAPPPQPNPPGPAQGAPQTPGVEAQPGTQLVAPLPPNLSLPGGRQKCFSGYNPQDKYCVECPQWIQQQCIPQTPNQAQLDVPAQAPQQQQAPVQQVQQPPPQQQPPPVQQPVQQPAPQQQAAPTPAQMQQQMMSPGVPPF